MYATSVCGYQCAKCTAYASPSLSTNLVTSHGRGHTAARVGPRVGVTVAGVDEQTVRGRASPPSPM